MAEEVPCLLRVGENVKKYKIFKLDKDQVTIGRSGEVTYSILSNMISRCHAIIKRQDGKTWTIMDNKSLNGVHINGKQLLPFTPYNLQEGDIVQLGVPTSPHMAAEFVYKFYSSLKVRIEKKPHKRFKPDPAAAAARDDRDTLSAEESIGSEEGREVKRKHTTPIKDPVNVKGSPNKILHQCMEKSQRQQAAKEAEYKARLEELERLLKEKEAREKEVQGQLEQERQEKENQAKEVEELRLKEQAILMKMLDKQTQLEKEKEELRKKIQAELEANLRERESVLMSQLAAQREALMTEKKQVEESLQKEVEKALEENNKELEQQLLDQKEKLEKILEKKDMEQKLLESQLNETKEESETAKLQALKARDEVLSNFVDLMEMELQCSICNELFIKATSLNCAHVFCKLCISQWMMLKKECPNCRTPITSQMQAIALDSYIDKMVEQLNDEMKMRRRQLVTQRKIEQDKFYSSVAGPSHIQQAFTVAATTTAPSVVNNITSVVTSRRRGRRQRSRGARGRIRAAGASRVTPATRVTTSRAAETMSVASGPTYILPANTGATTSTSQTSEAESEMATNILISSTESSYDSDEEHVNCLRMRYSLLSSDTSDDNDSVSFIDFE